MLAGALEAIPSGPATPPLVIAATLTTPVLSIVIGPVKGKRRARYAAYFGDKKANIYAVDAHTGDLLWKVNVEPRLLAHIPARRSSTAAIYMSASPARKKSLLPTLTTRVARTAEVCPLSMLKPEK